MTRQTSLVEVNNFVAGLVTEASPLNFPPNSSLDEVNFVLRRDGSRRRRLGIDFEGGYSIVNTPYSLMEGGVMQAFRWDNAGGDERRSFIVVQVANALYVFDGTTAVISGSPLYNTSFSTDGSKRFSFAVVDGILVVANGSSKIVLLKYDDGVFTEELTSLKIRDLFGVEDIYGGVNLREGSNISKRIGGQSHAHVYNLRNQTWALRPKVVTSENTEDAITAFIGPAGAWPSNSDVVTFSLYPDANDEDDRLTDRFNAKDVAFNIIGTSPAPKGYFIIDALSRGSSRLTEIANLHSRVALNYYVSALPEDRTPGGATVVAEYAGRAFYAGFSGEVIGGDSVSPRMSSYVLFSKLVDSSADLGTCYQAGDPTSKEEPDLLDTDGGFIRIDGAYGINELINVGGALLVIAANGVWKIQGGSEFGFKATNYMVEKITPYGCTSPGSIVQLDSGVVYWSQDGIYNVAKNQFGDYVADNLTQKTIQTLYDSLSNNDKVNCSAVYDSYERKVTWTYNNTALSNGNVKQLVFDITLGAFYKVELQGGGTPRVTGGVLVPPYKLELGFEDVEVEGVDVTVAGEKVAIAYDIETPSLTEVAYLTIVSASTSGTSFTFSKFSDGAFKDWASYNGSGFDAKAYLLAGWLSGGDNQRQKAVPWLTTYFHKTEDGFEVDEEGDYIPVGESSCRVSSQWNWTNSINSGKWSKSFQAYRHKRHYIPSSAEDEFDNGELLVVTKNKLRGSGKSVSILFETEPMKDCHLVGWSMIVGVNGYV